MPVAKIDLPDGTKVEIEGSVEEITKVVALYGQRPSKSSGPTQARRSEAPDSEVSSGPVDIPKIVELIKDSEESAIIDQRILDARDVMNRVLLPLYVVNKYIDPMMGLTSGEIAKVTDQLGVKVAISNASKTLSGSAKAYVTGDAVRKRGAAVRYRLTRRGVQRMEELLA